MSHFLLDSGGGLSGTQMVQVRMIFDEYSLVSSVALCPCSRANNSLWVCKSSEVWKLKKSF